MFGFVGIAFLAMGQEQLIREGSAEQRRVEIQSIQPDDPERSKRCKGPIDFKFLDRLIYPDGRIVAIRGFNSNGKPEYLTTFIT